MAYDIILKIGSVRLLKLLHLILQLNYFLKIALIKVFLLISESDLSHIFISTSFSNNSVCPFTWYFYTQDVYLHVCF